MVKREQPRRKPAGLLLTPGAGAGRDQSSLVAVEEALKAVDIVTTRMDFPYRRAGRRAPDRAPVLIASVVEGFGLLCGELEMSPERVALGGRSMGGRMCSMAVAEGLGAAALVLISYPLHPPGKADRLRTEHFPQITVPCLFVSGTKDAFGTQDELEGAVSAIPGPVTIEWITGGNHGLAKKDNQVAEIVRNWLVGL